MKIPFPVQSAKIYISYIVGFLLLLVTLVQAQQMCLTSRGTPGPDAGPGPRQGPETGAAVIFDSVSTLGTSTIEESLVDVSLANTTGEIKIKQPEGYSGVNYFYLLITASQKPMAFPRKARLFLMVNGKVPLSGEVNFTYFNSGGRRDTKNSIRVVGMTGIDGVTRMPLGVMEVTQEETTFEDMLHIHHGDTLR